MRCWTDAGQPSPRRLGQPDVPVYAGGSRPSCPELNRRATRANAARHGTRCWNGADRRLCPESRQRESRVYPRVRPDGRLNGSIPHKIPAPAAEGVFSPALRARCCIFWWIMEFFTNCSAPGRLSVTALRTIPRDNRRKVQNRKYIIIKIHDAGAVADSAQERRLLSFPSRSAA